MMTYKSQKVLIVDDHPLTREGIRSILENEKDIMIVGEAGNGLEAISQINEKNPDLVIMDITMPHMSGIDATKEILSKYPETKIVALSIHAGQKFVNEMLDAGAVGYLLKEEAPEELLRAIRKISKGDFYLSSTVTRAALKKSEEVDFNKIGILNSKLYRPTVMRDYVKRTKIIAELDKNVTKPLSLISAGPGYGKSVTVSQWLEETAILNCWISLGDEHNDIRVFLTYLVTAMGRLFPGMLEESNALASSAILPPTKEIAHILINELCNIEQDFIIVLDDYHLIKERLVHDLVNELIKFPPPNLHLCIITRRDPPLNLNPLLLSGRMIEIRMNDLSFSDHEISVFFNQLAQVDLNKEEISKLKTRTEGWVIALRLFSLINEDPVEKIKRLELVGEGQHTLSEYLLEEVLSNQPRHIQNLLMESSILNSFCEPLLQEILSNENKDTFNTNSLSLVDSLMKLNLFVIPLDDNQYWFRYHHMFQDFLQTQLKKNRNENEIIDLYKRAIHWFEMRKLITEAIEYVSHVNDTDKIVRLITENWEEILDKDDWTTVENWFTFLPTELVDQNPNLLLAQLWIAQRSHQLALVPGLIEKVEKIGSELSDTETGYLSFAKCMLSYFIGDVKGSLDAANKALQLIPAKYKCFRADAYSFWTFSMLMNGKEEMALHQFELNYQNIQPPGEPIQTSRTLMHPSFIAIAKANLPLLIKYNKLFFNIEGNSPYMLGWGNYIKSMISWWSNEPQQCKEDLERFLYFKYQSASSSVMDGYVCLALTCEKLGLSNSADKALVEGSEYAKTINDHSALETLDSGRSHLNLMRNNLEDAIDWLEGSEFLPLNPTMLFWVEIPSITQCRVLIARGETKDLEKGIMLLNEYLVYSESVNNVLRMIDILVLQAVGYVKMSKKDIATDKLRSAIDMASDGKWIRPFAEAIGEISDLLLELRRHGIEPDFIDLVFTSVEKLESLNLKKERTVERSSSLTHSYKISILTPSELKVLKLIGEGLRNHEIAERLFNSEETVKKHIYNMFQKMEVKNRLSLVAKAKEIGILE